MKVLCIRIFHHKLAKQQRLSWPTSNFSFGIFLFSLNRICTVPAIEIDNPKKFEGARTTRRDATCTMYISDAQFLLRVLLESNVTTSVSFEYSIYRTRYHDMDFFYPLVE